MSNRRSVAVAYNGKEKVLAKPPSFNSPAREIGVVD